LEVVTLIIVLFQAVNPKLFSMIRKTENEKRRCGTLSTLKEKGTTNIGIQAVSENKNIQWKE